jgi:hypothetical protein
MKTPMQQHMEWLDKKYISHLQDEETGLALEVWYCLKNAEEMLEKEKEAIMNAYDIGWSNGNKGQDLNDLYYNETFNTKEK